jgi:beta-glucosidase
MPWLDKVAGVVEAWYAGTSGHIALANVLTGEVDPSGKLAMTFPKTEADLPRPEIAPLTREDEGQGSGAVNGRTHVESKYSVSYDEGVKVGYKWYEAEHKQPLFPFGFGLSYTTFSYSGLKTDSAQKTVTFKVRNTGKRSGTEIAEVYATLPEKSGESFKHLVGFERVELSPGESKTVSVTVNPEVISIFDEQKNAFELIPGKYTIQAGPSSATTPLEGSFNLK